MACSRGFVKSVMFDGRESIDSGIDFTGTASSGLQVVVSMTAGQIVGTVTNPDGGPPAGAFVTLMPDGPPATIYRPELHPFVRTDATGHFVVKDVVPGTYRVYAWERLDPASEQPRILRIDNSVTFADAGFPRLFDSLGAVITVGENESKQVSLALISAARMESESRGFH
jgi:hypothetical protein